MSTDNNNDTKEDPEELKRLQDLEAKAVAEATAKSDASFQPSPALLNAPTADALMSQVDGPSLDNYEGKESVYVGRAVPLAAGKKLVAPIQVTSPGSVVEYAVETKFYDVGFEIIAERDEGVTIVKDMERVEATQTPVTGKFLVGSVPCMLNFTFDNEFSWMREKIVSYKITVTPPSRESLAAGRRRRAKACLAAVEEDLKSASQRLEAAEQQKATLHERMEKLAKEMVEMKKSWQVAETEEKWLKTRVNLRNDQVEMLQTRLTKGWEDEKSAENGSE